MVASLSNVDQLTSTAAMQGQNFSLCIASG
jgi:hypothetical protein